MSTKSPRHLWQKRWTIDAATRKVRHETGLEVQDLPSGVRLTVDEDAVRQALAVKHGHNAAAMVERLLREADLLLRDGAAARASLKGRTPTPGV